MNTVNDRHAGVERGKADDRLHSGDDRLAKFIQGR
jgi:hypothetical protein